MVSARFWNQVYSCYLVDLTKLLKKMAQSIMSLLCIPWWVWIKCILRLFVPAVCSFYSLKKEKWNGLYRFGIQGYFWCCFVFLVKLFSIYLCCLAQFVKHLLLECQYIIVISTNLTSVDLKPVWSLGLKWEFWYYISFFLVAFFEQIQHVKWWKQVCVIIIGWQVFGFDSYA